MGEDKKAEIISERQQENINENKKKHNKSVVLIGKNGEGRSFSAEELLAKGLNSWEGWQCSAGMENIHITHDGSIYGSVCRVGGYIGNVFENFVDFLPRYTLCKRKWCMCGSDMALRKFKSSEDIHWAYHDPKTEALENFDEFVACQPVQQGEVMKKQVQWDIGRRCNYSCSYCPPNSSNNYEAHRTWGSLKQAVNNIFKVFIKEDGAQFNFSGGEPTINPSFMDLVKYIRDRRPPSEPWPIHFCHVTTNGSRQPKYYEELFEHCHISISVHFEFFNEAKLLDVITAIVEKRKNTPHLQWQWLGVRLMIPPGLGKKALELMGKIYEIPFFREQARLNLSPIYKFKSPDGYDEYFPFYDQKELEFISSHG